MAASSIHRLMRCRLAWLVIAMLCIPACTSLGPIKDTTDSATSQANNQQHLASIADIKNFTLEGRIGVQTEGKGVSGTIHWQHINAKDDISLFSPMGGKMADVKTINGMVTLTSNDGKTYSAANAESLTEQTLGWRLPVGNLADWVLGRPTSSKIDQISWDSTGKLNKLTQDGWEIEYPEYRNMSGYALPSRLTLRNPKLYMKFVIENLMVERNSTSPSPPTDSSQFAPPAKTSTLAP